MSGFRIGYNRRKPVHIRRTFRKVDLIRPLQRLIDAFHHIGHRVRGIKTLVRVHLTGQIRIVQDLLDAEFARSEALLHNLLPDEIAARLKDRPGEVIADGLPAVTLLFADIVDFTPRSARMPPRPTLMSCPSTATTLPPLCALIWRLIECTSAIAA